MNLISVVILVGVFVTCITLRVFLTCCAALVGTRLGVRVDFLITIVFPCPHALLDEVHWGHVKNTIDQIANMCEESGVWFGEMLDDAGRILVYPIRLHLAPSRVNSHAWR